MKPDRRHIPAVGRALAWPEIVALSQVYGRAPVTGVLRRVLERARRAVSVGEPIPDTREVIAAVARGLETDARPSLRRVVNATGVIVHTNLGRAPLSEEAVRAVAAVAAGYSNLEYDLEHGARGSRHDHMSVLLTQVTGAPAAMVVNNNAAAVLLVLNTLAEGREVPVSRGELVEIGGSFRIPEIMAKSGCRLIEVGSTNKTHRRDFEAAINERTAALLKVHRSNFKMEGFVGEVSSRELVEIGRPRSIPVIEDLGSGRLTDAADDGAGFEPTVGDALAAGCGLVTFSGDKLLGGPQAGIIAGEPDLVASCRANPLARALRVDKMTLAALEATLRAYRDPVTARAALPVLGMVTAPLDVLRARARRWAVRWRRRWGEPAAVGVVETRSRVGGGSLPGHDLPGVAVAVTIEGMSADELSARLRRAEPPIVARIAEGRVLFEARTILDGEDRVIENALLEILRNREPAA